MRHNSILTATQVDEHYLDNCLSAFFQDQVPGLQQVFKGRTKALATPLGKPLASFGPNHLRQNQRLRQKLSVEERGASDERKVELAIWYVEKWGGVRQNDGGKALANFSRMAPADLVKQGSKRIASWSKILSYRRYRTYAVFDARVSGCLNAIQIVYGGELRHAFPFLATRGIPAKAFSTVLKTEHKPLPTLPDTGFYELYCRLLRSQWEKLPSHIRRHACNWHGLEMALFHHSAAMFERATNELGSRDGYDALLKELSAKNTKNAAERPKKRKDVGLG